MRSSVVFETQYSQFVNIFRFYWYSAGIRPRCKDLFKESLLQRWERNPGTVATCCKPSSGAGVV